jgi:aryl-alcohol dehydrogenase-like predicted oxidoreductase
MTRAGLDRQRRIAAAELGRTGLHVSQAGFGGYRISAGVAEHAAALQHALISGIDLIDTSANYADGGSEELVGQVLAHMLDSGELRRDAVVVVSKGKTSRSARSANAWVGPSRNWCRTPTASSTASTRNSSRTS